MKTSHKFLFILACMAFVGFIQSCYVGPLITEQPPQGAILGDGFGYYKHLLAVFVDKNYDHQQPDNRYVLSQGDRGVNKYFVGTAVLMMPFFSLSWLVAQFSGYPLNGLSPPFVYGLLISALCYLIIGLIFLYHTLIALRCRPRSAMITCLLTLFGTNLLYYSTGAYPMSHVYSFCAISCFAFLTVKFRARPSQQKLLALGLVLGIIAIIRPVNLIVVTGIPFLLLSAEGVKSVWRYIHQKPLQLLFAGVVFTLIVFIQVFSFRIQSGAWFVWSYKNEGFYFLKPALIPFLFSFKTGLFVYTPILAICALYMITVVRKSLFTSLAYLFFFSVVVYILSAWWSWSYGAAFGARPAIDFLAVLMIPIAFMLDKINLKQPQFKLPIYTALVCTAMLSMFQTYQLLEGILSNSMNFEKYTATFGVWNKAKSPVLGGIHDLEPYHLNKKIIYRDTFKADQPDAHWQADHFRTTVGYGPSVNYAGQVFNLRFHYTLPASDWHALFVELQLDRLEIDPNACSEAYGELRLLDSAGNEKTGNSFILNHAPSSRVGHWKSWTYTMEVMGSIDKNDRLKFYIWNPNKRDFLVDNIGMSIYGLSND